MDELNFKNLDSLINEVEIEKKNKILQDKNEKYRNANEFLDTIIKYCYNNEVEIFVLDNIYKEMCSKNLKILNREDFELDILTDILIKKNIEYYLLEGNLVINISTRKCSKNEYEAAYFENKINNCIKLINGSLKGILIGVLFTVLLNLGQDTFIKNIYTIEGLRKILFYILIFIIIISIVNLIDLIKKKRIYKEKLRRSRIVLEDDSVDLY